MPVPHSVTWGGQRFGLDKSFYIVQEQSSSERVNRAAERFLRRLNDRTHLMTSVDPVKNIKKSEGLYLLVRFKRTGELKPGEDESYRLTITGDQALLEAETDLGVLHGLETVLQLITTDEKGYYLPGAVISDKPRFVWRGLLIDVCRHWAPVEVIKRNIDGMAMMKLNVLHLHLTEDQGFRIESKVFPKLHQMGSNGDYFTQEQMRDIIAYAGMRGIRVVPEFDMPGHASSWMPGYPDLSSGPGPHAIERKFGVFDPTIDPTKKSTYKFLNKFLGEMAALFPDPYMHIGGDENNGIQWDKNPAIREFKKKNNLNDNHALQNYFNTRVMAILKKHRKKMIGWDEILQPGLPSDAVIQSWRGKEGLREAAIKGYDVILSNGYYIDLAQPTWKHYTNDPLPADLGLTADQQKRVLGGEATMWAELVTHETIDSRIWPRTAAIAERLWSPAEIRDIPDMYRRLKMISLRLEEVGLQHIRNRDFMLRRIAGDYEIAPLKKLVEVTEPLKDYTRHSQGIAYSTDLPFSRLADIATPDADVAREFNLLCEMLVMKKQTQVKTEISAMLHSWITNHEEIKLKYSGVPALKNWIVLSARLAEASKTALESLDFMERRQVITDEWTSSAQKVLDEAAKPADEAELMVISGIKLLFNHALPK